MVWSLTLTWIENGRMIRMPVNNMAGATVGDFELDEQWFGGRVNRSLLRQAVLAYESNRRRGTARAKRRGEVAGSGRKPWRQKGTGRARHGSHRSPIWVGGGVAHGPRARDYKQKLNRKVKLKAFSLVGLIDAWSMLTLYPAGAVESFAIVSVASAPWFAAASTR